MAENFWSTSLRKKENQIPMANNTNAIDDHLYYDNYDYGINQLLNFEETPNIPERTIEPLPEPNFFTPSLDIQNREQPLEFYDANEVFVDSGNLDPCIQPDGLLNGTLPPNDYMGNFTSFVPDYGICNDHHQQHYFVNGNQMLPPLVHQPFSDQFPVSCDNCQSLREIVLCNGSIMKLLDIHGQIGLVTHAILKMYDNTRIHDLQTYDFSLESIESVKEFLVGFLEDSKQDGFTLMEDRFSAFYDALSVRFQGDSLDGFCLPPNHSGNPQTSLQERTHNQPGAGSSGTPKISLSEQRARTGKMELKDFTQYFNLPIEEAARRMNVCVSVMKKIRSKGGLSRWPYRKIRSIRRKIEKQKQVLRASDSEARAQAEADIQNLQQQVANIFERFNLSPASIQQLIEGSEEIL